MKTTLTVNDQSHEVEHDPRRTLLDTLRNDLGLPENKKGCDHGQCGACTFLLNGERVNSCLCLTAMHDGDEITTIEGIGTPERLSALRQAVVEKDGYQCGYCTPGQIMSATVLLREVADGAPSYVGDDLGPPDLSDSEMAERMSGNVWRHHPPDRFKVSRNGGFLVHRSHYGVDLWTPPAQGVFW